MTKVTEIDPYKRRQPREGNHNCSRSHTAYTTRSKTICSPRWELYTKLWAQDCLCKRLSHWSVICYNANFSSNLKWCIKVFFVMKINCDELIIYQTYPKRKLLSSKRITNDYKRMNNYLMCNITHNIIIESD